MRKTAEYGSWTSAISAEMLGSAAVKLGQTYIDAERVYWIESRPAEKGRNVLVSSDFCGNVQDVTPSSYNVRSAVHEYGGGVAIVTDGKVYFSHFGDH